MSLAWREVILPVCPFVVNGSVELGMASVASATVYKYKDMHIIHYVIMMDFVMIMYQ